MLKISGGGARTGGRRGAGAGGGLLQLVCRSEYFNLNTAKKENIMEQHPATILSAASLIANMFSGFYSR